MAGDISEEIFRTLLASIGLVLAIPLTTGIASALAGGAEPESEPARVKASEYYRDGETSAAETGGASTSAADAETAGVNPAESAAAAVPATSAPAETSVATPEERPRGRRARRS